MTAVAVIYIACMAVIFAFLLLTPEHKIDGAAGKWSFLFLFASGLALAIHAL